MGGGLKAESKQQWTEMFETEIRLNDYLQKLQLVINGKYSIANGFPNEQTNNRINDFQVKVSAKKIGHHKICTAMLTYTEIMCH